VYFIDLAPFFLISFSARLAQLISVSVIQFFLVVYSACEAAARTTPVYSDEMTRGQFPDCRSAFTTHFDNSTSQPTHHSTADVTAPMGKPHAQNSLKTFHFGRFFSRGFTKTELN
jgi:hypothetical protein